MCVDVQGYIRIKLALDHHVNRLLERYGFG
jgi:hypothetical protein